MPRFSPYIGVTVAIVVAAFILGLSNSVSVVNTASLSGASVASSTLAVIPAVTIPPIEFPTLSLENEITAATETAPPIEKAPVLKKPAPAKVATSTPVASAPSVPATVEVAPQASSGDIGLDASAASLRAALVNILCYIPLASGLRSISGSGIVIDSKGIILTNAHIAQYFLLADRGAHCTLRLGSPAADRFTAALIYISPSWLRANASIITQAEPSGTGEFDYALLAVTGSATSAALPASFPSMPLAELPPTPGTPIVIASYGAQFLESSQVRDALFPTVVFGSVKDVFTFTQYTIDVLALGGSAAAQEGSSGGGVATASGSLVGTITTSTVTGATASRSLDAITASYIRSAYASETGQALNLLLAQDPATAAAAFAPQIPSLESILTANLP